MRDSCYRLWSNRRTTTKTVLSQHAGLFFPPVRFVVLWFLEQPSFNHSFDFSLLTLETESGSPAALGFVRRRDTNWRQILEASSLALQWQAN
jgi:hypothetical protein